MTTTWTQVTRYFQINAANVNSAPKPKRIIQDLNAMRIARDA